MIKNFSNENHFLSNFSDANVTYKGFNFPSSEQAYQFAKVQIKDYTPALLAKFQNCTPGQSKRLGAKTNMRPDWDKVKVKIMKEILRSKFENKELCLKLLNTGTQEIQEGNTWNDTFWGVCNEKGSNHLGKLLMKLRKEFQQTNLEELV